MSSQENGPPELLSETVDTNKPESVGHKQAGGQRKTDQLIFDVIFGVVAPILLLILDPAVFRSCSGEPLYGQYAIFAYLAIPLGVIILLIWLMYGKSLKAGSDVISGILLAGSVFAFGLGVLLVPYSILGLFFCIGILGFTPFITGFVYLRNAERAFRRERERAPGRNRLQLTTLVLIGALLVIGLPAVAQWQIAAHPQSAAAQWVESIINGNGLSYYTCGLFPVPSSGE